MADNYRCVICGAPDSWKHSLLECHMAKCVWAVEKEELVEHLCETQDMNPRDWLLSMIESLNQEDLTRVVVTLWAIWYARRKVIHDNIFQSPLSTHKFVSRFISDFNETKATTATKPRVAGEVSRWLSPPEGMMKINVDAALSKNLGKSAAGAVVRYRSGHFMGASILVLHGHYDPEVVEGIACREGLALAADLGLRKFRLVSDSAMVVKSLKEPGMGPYGHIAREIKAKANAFQLVEFNHENRRSNVDAHCLARSSLFSDTGRHVWLVSPPDGVCSSCSAP